MTFDPILNAPVYLQLHVATALIALCLGPVPLYRKRRDIWHKVIGYVWMLGMVITAITSFWIREIMADGSMSPVHIFAFWNLGTVVFAIWAVRRGNIIAHKHALNKLYYFGTWGAFIVNFMPNRTIPTLLFDGGSWLTFGMAATMIISLIMIARLWTWLHVRAQ